MIFTSQFGALAARPIFPSITASEEQDAPDIETHDDERHDWSTVSAA